jgi:RNA polymerase sigma-70 factor (sigma-E family)
MRERPVLMRSDERVVAGIEPRAGSLEDLYIRHVPDAMRLAYLLTRDGPAAEDVAQEAFIKVAGRLRHLRSPASFDAYLRRTVINLCMSHHRRQRTARIYVEREAGGPSVREAATGLPDIETQDELRAALVELPDRQRAAVVLRYYLDLSEGEVAYALGCSAGAARSLVFRAMETLRSRIGGEA